jgi:hypothetical protein
MLVMGKRALADEMPCRLRIDMPSVRSIFTSGWRICFCDGSKRPIVNLLQLHELVKGKHTTLRVKVWSWRHKKAQFSKGVRNNSGMADRNLLREHDASKVTSDQGERARGV